MFSFNEQMLIGYSYKMNHRLVIVALAVVGFGAAGSRAQSALTDPATTNRSNPAIEALKDKDPCGGHRLRDWLKQQGVTHVVMESTGSYWKPVFVRDVHLARLPSSQQSMKCEACDELLADYKGAVGFFKDAVHGLGARGRGSVLAAGKAARWGQICKSASDALIEPWRKEATSPNKQSLKTNNKRGTGGLMICQTCNHLLAAYNQFVNLFKKAVQNGFGAVGGDSRVTAEQATRLGQQCKEVSDAFMEHWRRDHNATASSPPLITMKP